MKCIGSLYVCLSVNLHSKCTGSIPNKKGTRNVPRTPSRKPTIGLRKAKGRKATANQEGFQSLYKPTIGLRKAKGRKATATQEGFQSLYKPTIGLRKAKGRKATANQEGFQSLYKQTFLLFRKADRLKNATPFWRRIICIYSTTTIIIWCQH